MSTTNLEEVAKNKCIAMVDQTREQILGIVAGNMGNVQAIKALTHAYMATRDWKVFDGLTEQQRYILIGVLEAALTELSLAVLLREEEAAEDPGS